MLTDCKIKLFDFRKIANELNFVNFKISFEFNEIVNYELELIEIKVMKVKKFNIEISHT